MGQIQYTQLSNRKCNDCAPTIYDIPIGATAYEIALITGFCLEDAIEASKNIIQENNELCPTIYLSEVQTKEFIKYCPNGGGSTVTVSTSSGQFSSQFNQADANQKALQYLEEQGQLIANQLGTCPDLSCLNCPEFEIIELKDCGELRQYKKCVSGVCVDESEPVFECTGNCIGEECVSVNDCPEGEQGNCPDGYICRNGRCVLDCSGQECSDICLNGACPSGSSCVNGVCVPDEPPCTLCAPQCPTGECPNGYICVDGRCKRDCTNQPYSDLCPDGDCPNICDTKDNGRCIPLICTVNQILNETTCQCEQITCQPACVEVRDPSQDTDCQIAFVQQTCQVDNGVATCVNTASVRFENKPDGTLCSTGVCRNGVCSSDCIPTCEDGDPQEVPGSDGCANTIQQVECINANCENTSVITVNEPDGTDCINNGENSTCLDGKCKEVIPDFCGQLSSSTGGPGITDRLYTINSKIVFVIDFDPLGVEDKLEILKETYFMSGSFNIVATSGINSISNSGPFDPDSGINSSNVNINTLSFTPVANQPFEERALSGGALSYLSDWYIGTDRTQSYSTRTTEFTADTGFVFKDTLGNNVSSGDQLIWTTVNGNPTTPERVLVRVSGPSGTGWNYTPQCFKLI